MDDKTKKLEFPLLEADDIEVRVGTINTGGVQILLYKDARCDQRILDDVVGPMNWQKHYSRDNANCIVSIKDEDGNWIDKEDTGIESNMQGEKGLASDSFKRACFCWGIGRELYTAKALSLFFEKGALGTGYTYTKDEKTGKGKGYCCNTFKVADIKYDDKKRIDSVTIEAYLYGNKLSTKTFTRNGSKTTNNANVQANQQPNSKPSQSQTRPQTPSQNANQAAPKQTSGMTNQSSQNTATKPATTGALIAEDEVILIGNCRGKKYGEVKDTPTFKSFLAWVAGSNSTYRDEKQSEQFKRLKQLAQSQTAK